MDTHVLDELIACLPTGRTCFYYQPDQHIAVLLHALHRTGHIKTLADLKASAFAKWLNHPWVKQFMASQPSLKQASITTLLNQPLQAEYHPFTLSVGRWGSKYQYDWCQSTRKGENLVLHLNASNHINQMLQQLGITEYTTRSFHPHHPNKITLAWARLDIDLDHGQVLIEELQNDFIRDLQWTLHYARPNQPQWFMGAYVDTEQLRLVCAHWLHTYHKLWADAMLTATLHFIFNELGIFDVYYHTWHSGKCLKRLHKYGAPPVSVYSQLPERFGFTRTTAWPRMLHRNPHVLRRAKCAQQPVIWYRLHMPQACISA